MENTTIQEPMTYNMKDKELLLKSMNKMFERNYRRQCDGEESFGIIEQSSCVMIIAMSERARTILEEYVAPPVDGMKPCKIPTMNYTGVNSKSKMNAKWLKWAVSFLELSFPTVTLQVGKDYPITMSNTDWSIIIAPRVDNDEY